MSKQTLTFLNVAKLCLFALLLWITVVGVARAAESGEEGHAIALCFDYELIKAVAQATDAGQDELATRLLLAGIEANECVIFAAPVVVTLESLERRSNGRYRFDIWAARWHGLAVYVTAEPAGEQA